MVRKGEIQDAGDPGCGRDVGKGLLILVFFGGLAVALGAWIGAVLA
jgi:hypothetical protein